MLKHKHRGGIAALAAAAIAAVLLVPSVAVAEVTLDYEPEVNPVADNVTRLEVNKLKKGSRDFVEGAHLQILDENGNVVKDANGNPVEWVSGKGYHEIAKVLDIETVYILHEVSAPDGYNVAKDTKFILHSEDFNTTGEIISGDDAEFTTVSGAGPDQAFVINLYDEARIEVEKVVHKQNKREIEHSRERLAKTGDLFNQPLFIGLCAGGFVAIALGVRKARKSE